MMNGFLDQIEFVANHNEKRLPETWFFTARETHNFYAMILVADEITTSLKKRRDRDGRRRLRI